MSWRAIKKALNSTLGEKKFKPLDKILIEELTNFIKKIKNGDITVGNAEKATQDSDGNVIPDTYVKKSDAVECLYYRYSLQFQDKTFDNIVASPSSCAGVLQISNFNRTPKVGEFFSGMAVEKNGLYFYYTAKITEVTGGQLFGTASYCLVFAQNIVKVSSANTANSATQAAQDSVGNVIFNTYVKKSELEEGTFKVAKATNADSATKDSVGNVIFNTYVKKNDLTKKYLHQIVMSINEVTNMTCAISFNYVSSDYRAFSTFSSIKEELLKNKNKRIPASGGLGDGSIIVGLVATDEENINIIAVGKTQEALPSWDYYVSDIVTGFATFTD